MVYNIDNINYVITGKDQKMVNLTISPKDSPDSDSSGASIVKTFITDEGMDLMGGFYQEYNSHRLKILLEDAKTYLSVNTMKTIFSLFDIKDVAIKSPMFKSLARYDIESPYDIEYSPRFIDRFNSHMDDDPLEFCQLDEEAVGIGLESDKFLALKKTNLIDTRYDRLNNNENSLDWFFKIGSSENETFTYIPLSDLSYDQEDNPILSDYSRPDSYYSFIKSHKLSSEVIDKLFEEKYIYRSVKANQIFNVKVDEPLGKDAIYNDFNNGIVRGLTRFGKNDYDAEFSMNMQNVGKLKHARNYIGIGNVGNRLFLKYYDEIDYGNDSQQIPPTSLSADPQILSVEGEYPLSNSYQNVEIFDASMSFMGNYSRHKANLYAITIKNAGLSPDASPSLADKMDVIRAQVANTVRTIAENLAPAHTQLLQVNFKDNWNGGTGYDLFKITFMLNEVPISVQYLPLSTDVTQYAPKTYKDKDHEYVITGWDPELSAVTQDQVYVAKYENPTKTIITFTDGSIVEYDFYDTLNLQTMKDNGLYTDSWIKFPKKVKIGTDISSIGNAFYSCLSLEDVFVPDTVTSIGPLSFYECANLSNINIPNTVMSLLDVSFQGCVKLTSIELPNSITSIPRSLFTGCGFESFVIPNSVILIGDNAFDNCFNMSSISIGSSVTTIGRAAFAQCKALTSIVIPESVIDIKAGTFTGCINLNDVIMEGKEIADVNSMPVYYRFWQLKSGCIIHCTNGTITV